MFNSLNPGQITPPPRAARFPGTKSSNAISSHPLFYVQVDLTVVGLAFLIGSDGWPIWGLTLLVWCLPAVILWCCVRSRVLALYAVLLFLLVIYARMTRSAWPRPWATCLLFLGVLGRGNRAGDPD